MMYDDNIDGVLSYCIHYALSGLGYFSSEGRCHLADISRPFGAGADVINFPIKRFLQANSLTMCDFSLSEGAEKKTNEMRCYSFSAYLVSLFYNFFYTRTVACNNC